MLLHILSASLLFDFIFCGKIQQSAEGWTVSTSTKPLLQLLMSHLTKDHYAETPVHTAKVQGWHGDSGQSKDMICKSSSLVSSLVQTSTPPVSQLALCFWKLLYCCRQSLLHCVCAGKFLKDLIQNSEQGRGLGMLDQPCQCDLEIQANDLTVCCWFSFSVCQWKMLYYICWHIQGIYEI